MTKYLTLLFISISGSLYSQIANVQEQTSLQQLYQDFRTKEIQDSIQVAILVESSNFKLHEMDGKSTIGFVGFEPNGFPIFYSTDNSLSLIHI